MKCVPLTLVLCVMLSGCNSSKVNSIRILTTESEPIEGAIVVLGSTRSGTLIAEAGPTDEIGFASIPQTYHFDTDSEIFAKKDGMETPLDITSAVLMNKSLVIKMYADGKWLPSNSGLSMFKD